MILATRPQFASWTSDDRQNAFFIKQTAMEWGTHASFLGEKGKFSGILSGGGLPVDFYRQPEAVASWQVGK